MDLAHPEFVPDSGASHEEMEAQQRALVESARFEDDCSFDPAAVGVADPLELEEGPSEDRTAPIVVGIDQAFLEDVGVSAAVAIQGDQVVEVACGRRDLAIPYIPGLLAFREGGPILAALQELSVDPDLLVFDGQGRIHPRQAGIATHIGVVLDVPAIGVAKNLLCGKPTEPLEGHLEAGTRVEIRADEAVEAPPETPPDTLLGYALQTRQFPNPERRHVNPVFVSPGHRLGPATAADLAESLCAGYKLPEPVRLADRAAAECKD